MVMAIGKREHTGSQLKWETHFMLCKPSGGSRAAYYRVVNFYFFIYKYHFK
jgi:hypothetical protein